MALLFILDKFIAQRFSITPAPLCGSLYYCGIRFMRFGKWIGTGAHALEVELLLEFEELDSRDHSR